MFEINLHDRSGVVHPLIAEVGSGSYCSTVFHDCEFLRVPLKQLKGQCFAYGGIEIMQFEGYFTVNMESGLQSGFHGVFGEL